ncbi:RHS repeat-associated core domain-containing protein, partial [Dyella sp.]|uniref:RHS repeat-associated core domain-containing protein n=1 Tax=Dyella sp. TaxID=1869338 RepID=UPI002B48A367
MSRMQAMKRDAAPPRPTQEKRRWKRRLIACMAILPWAPAYAGFETALGHVDGVAQVGSGEMVVRGWSCWTDVSTVSPQVELYVGGERDRGGIKIATAATDQPNEPDVDQVCRTQNRPHRFAIALNIAIRQQYADRTIYVYSVPAFPSGTYTLLGGSGQYTVPAAPAVADAVYYIHTDRLGSNVIMTDDKANVVAKTDYKAYGAASDNQQKNEAPGYTGHYEDPLTELTYMQQRYYDADLGRFLSVDPIAGGPGNVFNFNRYAYASNNPLKFVDPTGMLQQVPHMLD